MANGEVSSPSELYRLIQRAQIDIDNLTAARERDQSVAKADRHAFANSVSEQLAEYDTKILNHAEKLGRVAELSVSQTAMLSMLIAHAEKLTRLDEKIGTVSSMGGKGLSMVLTSALGLAIGLLGAWLSVKLK